MREDKTAVGDTRQHKYLLLYISIHAHTSLLLDVPLHFYLFSLFHLTHLLQLLVPHCSLLSLSHQIFCSRTTAAPFLQSSPLIHTTDILAHCLVSLSTCIQNSQSLGHFSRVFFCSQAMRPTAVCFILYRQGSCISRSPAI